MQYTGNYDGSLDNGAGPNTYAGSCIEVSIFSSYKGILLIRLNIYNYSTSYSVRCNSPRLPSLWSRIRSDVTQREGAI